MEFQNMKCRKNKTINSEIILSKTKLCIPFPIQVHLLFMNCTVMINHSDVNNNNPKLNEDLWKKVNSNQFDIHKIIRNITANNCSKFQVCI